MAVIPSFFSFSRAAWFSLRALLILLFLGETAWVHGGTIQLINPNPNPWVQPPVLDSGYGSFLEAYPLWTATLSLPGLPEGGVVEMEPVEMSVPQALQVVALGSPRDDGEMREYAWQEDPDARFRTHEDEGEVYLRWYRNGQLINSFSKWLRDGNAGKGGSYQVRLIQTQRTGSFYLKVPFRRGMEFSSVLATVSFDLVIRGHTPLPAGAVPEFASKPDLPGLPAVTVVPDEGLVLAAMAKADTPPRIRWFKNEAGWREGLEVRVMPRDVSQTGTNFYCQASGPTGTVVTETFRLRAPAPVWVDFTSSVTAIEEGGTVRLVPGVTSDQEVNFSWTGPALTAGYEGAQVLEDGTLEISPARTEDTGDYFVTVTNGELDRTHRLRVSVLRLPRGTYALGAGQEIPLMGVRLPSDSSDEAVQLSWEFLGRGSGAAVTFDFPYWNDRSSNGLGPQLLKPVARMAGEYRCEVRIQPLVPQSRWIGSPPSPFVFTQDVESAPFLAESVFDLRAPWEEPKMPAHELPTGRIGAQYDAPAPERAAGAGSAAVRYLISGLPRGLKGFPDGSVKGRPLKSGDFLVKFVAVNAQGRSEEMEVILSILPVPEGIVGDWMIYPVEAASPGWMQFKVSHLGTVSGRRNGRPFVGVVTADEDDLGSFVISNGDALMPHVKLHAATSLAELRQSAGGGVSGRGWRNVWSRSNPTEVYAGRYNFYAEPLASPRSEEVAAESGYRSGSALVAATGQVKTVLTGEQGRASTAGFFLGPQGQVLHEIKERGTLTAQHYLELAIDETGQEIYGRKPVYWGIFKKPGREVLYIYHDLSTRALWPYLLESVYHGRRYTPPATKLLPAGFSLPDAGADVEANAALTLGLQEAVLFSTPDSEVTAETQSWLLGKGGRMQPMSPATHATTCKVHLPTGHFFGKVYFADGNRRPPATKFQGYLVPQSEGGMAGYGATEPARGWDTLPVRLEAIQPKE